MQIVRHAKHVGTMIGPDGYLHRWHTGKIVQRVLKINASIKSLVERVVERLCDLDIKAVYVLSFIGSVCAPDKVTLRTENHASQTINRHCVAFACFSSWIARGFPAHPFIMGLHCTEIKN